MNKLEHLEEDVNILSRLLEEDSESIRTKLRKYAAEDQHMRMQLVLRDYFREEKTQMKPDIEQEARSIAVIFPDIPVEIIQDMLIETGNQADRSRFVIKKLCTKRSATKQGDSTTTLIEESSGRVDDNKNKIIDGGVDVAGEMFDRDKLNKVGLCDEIEGKIKLESEAQSNNNPQPSTSSFVDPLPHISQAPTFNRNLYERALEVFPDASPRYMRSLCERRDFTDLNLAEVVQTLMDGDYPKRIF